MTNIARFGSIFAWLAAGLVAWPAAASNEQAADVVSSPIPQRGLESTGNKIQFPAGMVVKPEPRKAAGPLIVIVPRKIDSIVQVDLRNKRAWVTAEAIDRRPPVMPLVPLDRPVEELIDVGPPHLARRGPALRADEILVDLKPPSAPSSSAKSPNDGE